MFFNDGTLMIIFALGASTIFLFIFLLLIAIAGRKKDKSGGLAVLKVFSILFVITTIGLSIASSLAYYNYIPVNIKYGKYESLDGSKTYLQFHRDSVEIHEGGSSYGIKGNWSLKSNKLRIEVETIRYTFEMKDFGSKIYKDGELAYKYSKGL